MDFHTRFRDSHTQSNSAVLLKEERCDNEIQRRAILCDAQTILTPPKLDTKRRGSSSPFLWHEFFSFSGTLCRCFNKILMPEMEAIVGCVKNTELCGRLPTCLQVFPVDPWVCASSQLASRPREPSPASACRRNPEGSRYISRST